MRYLFSSALCLVLASCDVAPWSYDIGDGLVLVQTPPKYKTVSDNKRCEQLLNAMERGVISARFETKTETIIVQEASAEVAVTPIEYEKNGSVKTEAKVRIRRIPSVSKQVANPDFSRPLGDELRKFLARCKPTIRRVIWTPATYIIKDKSGATIKDFETAEALAEYINSK